MLLYISDHIAGFRLHTGQAFILAGKVCWFQLSLLWIISCFSSKHNVTLLHCCKCIRKSVGVDFNFSQLCLLSLFPFQTCFISNLMAFIAIPLCRSAAGLLLFINTNLWGVQCRCWLSHLFRIQNCCRISAEQQAHWVYVAKVILILPTLKKQTETKTLKFVT